MLMWQPNLNFWPEEPIENICVRGLDRQRPDDVSFFRVGRRVCVKHPNSQKVWAIITGFMEDRLQASTYLGERQGDPAMIAIKVRTNEGEDLEIAPVDIVERQ